MEHRNRASGWKHAKLSGHQNESKLEDLMLHDEKTRLDFLDKIGKSGHQILQIDVGGLNEKDIPCVFDNEKTKSKTDMHVVLEDGSKFNVSIKKSLGGQVYLINADRFINGFEIQYKQIIETDVKRAIHLFWGYDSDTLDLIEKYGTNKKYEKHKNRLVAETLRSYDPNLYDKLIKWFVNNISQITDFCFSKGLAKNPEDWANLIWYKNELGETNINKIYSIATLCKKITEKLNKSSITYGTREHGSTIQLPFGFVQWHSPQKTIPGCMQFHHKYEKIEGLFK